MQLLLTQRWRKSSHSWNTATFPQCDVWTEQSFTLAVGHSQSQTRLWISAPAAIEGIVPLFLIKIKTRHHTNPLYLNYLYSFSRIHLTTEQHQIIMLTQIYHYTLHVLLNFDLKKWKICNLCLFIPIISNKVILFSKFYPKQTHHTNLNV